MQAQYIPKFDLQGHRGARGLKPENTIPAFITALDFGVTTVELDVVITKDQQVVVSHEPWLSPEICLDKEGKEFSEEKKFLIYKMTYDELRHYDCGLKGNGRFPQQEKLSAVKPLLKDVFVATENHIKNFSQYEVDYNIEIKSTKSGDNKEHPAVDVFSDLVFQTIDQYLPWERIVIQSFDFRVLQYWHKKYPKVRLAMLVENAKPLSTNLKNLGFNPSIYSPYFKMISEADIKSAKALKIRVIPWTVNEVDDMIALKEKGVDGLITDYPNKAAEIGLTLRKQN